MTREEAINLISEFMVIDDWSMVYLPNLHDALELAIEALEKERLTCNTCHYWHRGYCKHHETSMYSNDYCSEYIKKYEGEAE